MKLPTLRWQLAKPISKGCEVPQATIVFNRCNHHASWWIVLLGSTVIAACESAVPADRSADVSADVASAGACNTRVIMTFTENLGERPADGFVTEISRRANVLLAFVRAAGPGLYVFQLDAPAPDESCEVALEHIRRDERVRSVDIDRRRRVQEQGTVHPAPGLPLTR
jgi:hypothetical protein